MTTFSSNSFSFANSTFTAEASTLGLKPGEWPSEIGVQSIETARVVFYSRKHKPIVSSMDLKEIVAWDYYPCKESLENIPGCSGTKVTIWND